MWDLWLNSVVYGQAHKDTILQVFSTDNQCSQNCKINNRCDSKTT